MKKSDLIFLGAGAVGVFLLWRYFSQLTGNVTEKLTQTGEKIGGAVYELFHPDEGIGETLYYTVTFPDGKKHAVGSQTVDEQGRFRYVGPFGAKPYGEQVFRLATDTASKQRVALAI